MNTFLWVILPYITLTIFVLGLIYRYNFDQIGWAARSTEIFEKTMLQWGSLLFHWGILAAFGGHVVGILIPIGVYRSLGVTTEMYHTGAILLGGMAGIATLSGLVILTVRRLVNARVRRHTSAADWLALIVLLVVVSYGDWLTLGYNLISGPFEYRTTVGPWFRGLFYFNPHATLVFCVKPVVLIDFCEIPGPLRPST
ncbi:respiratory nitrate reductase subunit gamma, partial [Sulfobacillus harzensis]|nr:respiratory nitrate reductase subunit gamma [Sulfobacillus harzensis]